MVCRPAPVVCRRARVARGGTRRLDGLRWLTGARQLVTPGPGHALRGPRAPPVPGWPPPRPSWPPGGNGWPGSSGPPRPYRRGWAPQRDRRLAEIDARHAARIAELARRAADAARREAPGAASAPTGRGGGPRPPAGPSRPGALRVGTVRIAGAEPVPALVPLLDAGHVAPDRRRPRRLRRRGVRAAAARPSAGPTRARYGCIGYDPEHLGGGLAGFAPLGTAGLLTFVGPGGLGRLLDDLVEQIRRINETVLAGEYGSLRELAAATGRRPEPWRVAVLLGGDELSRHERGQLDRVVRTGAACGVHLVVRGVPLPDDPTVTRVVAGTPTAPASAGRPACPYGSTRRRRPTLVTETCREVAARVNAGPPPTPFTDLLPAAGADVAGGLGATG